VYYVQIYFAVIQPTLNAPPSIHPVTLFDYVPKRFGARRRNLRGAPSQLLTFQTVILF